MSGTKPISLPLSRDAAAALQLGDMVTLDGPVVMTAGIPTHQRILEGLRSGTAPPIDLRNAAFFHLGSYSVEKGDAFDVLYMNPTTSTRFNEVMPEIIRHFELRCVGGKGGLDATCAQSLGDVGGIYLSFLGGGAPLLSAAIRKVLDVAWNDLIAHYRLVSMEVADLGPLTVAIDARGNSLYDRLNAEAASRRGEILKRLAERRARSGK